MAGAVCQGRHIAAARAIDCDWKGRMDVQDGILGILPPAYRQALGTIQLQDAEELRLRAGYPPTVLRQGKEQPFFPATGGGCVTQEDLQRTLMAASSQSQYAVQTQLAQGFVSLPGGVRMGVCGSVILHGGQPAGIREISSLAIRLPHDIRHDAKILLPHLTDSCLICGAPGSGKTTLLRSCIRALSETGRRVGVADERMELAGQPGAGQWRLGAHTDVLSGGCKAEAMLMLLRGMNPEWIAVDEITAPADLQSIRHLAGCGVRLLATVHASDLQTLSRRPLLQAILRQGIFPCALFLHSDRTFHAERISYAQNDRTCSDSRLVQHGGVLPGTRGACAADAAACAP